MSEQIADYEIEEEIIAKRLTAPRVTIDHIQAAIEDKVFQRIEGTNVTICVLKLKNGFNVIGYSACVSDGNFDKELGEKIAYQKCIDQCWALFGFHLASMASGWIMDS